mgnify:CR=1 FL=1
MATKLRSIRMDDDTHSRLMALAVKRRLSLCEMVRKLVLTQEKREVRRA